MLMRIMMDCPSVCDWRVLYEACMILNNIDTTCCHGISSQPKPLSLFSVSFYSPLVRFPEIPSPLSFFCLCHAAYLNPPPPPIRFARANLARDLLDMRLGGNLVQTGADYLDSGVVADYNAVMYQAQIRPSHLHASHPHPQPEAVPATGASTCLN